MKTIEEKAKRYDEAIEKFDVILNLNTVKESGTIFADDVIKILPELKESEDERIINLLKMVVEKWHNVGYADYVMDIPKSDIIAWLEKQGEQKPVKTPQWMIYFLNEHRSNFGHAVDYDERKEIEGKLLCIKQWLEGNPIIEQNPVEWSEEVEAAINLLKDIAEEQEEDYCPYNANKLRKAAQYLETCRPQKHWKPSDEQMRVLALSFHGIYKNEDYVILKGLFEQLKAL